MKYKGVIFDFNGVLLWDASLHVRAWQDMAVQLRGAELSDDEIAIHVHGRTNTHILSYLSRRTLPGKELLDIVQIKESMYRDLCLRNPQVFVLSPGAESLLNFLSAKGIPRTIATSSERTNLDFFAHHLGLATWFHLQQIVYDDGLLPGKPAPDMYSRAASNIRLPPNECIVVEDAISGFESAHAANIGHIVGLGPRMTHSKLIACDGVSTVIESLEQFPRELLQNA